MTWKGHVAIVTGAGSGIGKGIAARFAEAGAEVVVAEVNPQRGEAVAQELQAQYGKGLFVATNVASAADCQALIQRTADVAEVFAMANDIAARVQEGS